MAEEAEGWEEGKIRTPYSKSTPLSFGPVSPKAPPKPSLKPSLKASLKAAPRTPVSSSNQMKTPTRFPSFGSATSSVAPLPFRPSIYGPHNTVAQEVDTHQPPRKFTSIKASIKTSETSLANRNKKTQVTGRKQRS